MEVPFGALSKNEGHGWLLIVRTQSSGVPRASQGQPGTLGTQLYSGGTRQQYVPLSLQDGFQDVAAPLNCAACCREGVCAICPENVVSVQLLTWLFPKNISPSQVCYLQIKIFKAKHFHWTAPPSKFL